MSREFRPLKINETYDHLGLKYGLDTEIYHERFEFDVAVWSVEDQDSEEDEGFTYICVPNQSLLEMLSLHLDMSYNEALDITGAHILWVHDDCETVKEQLEAIRIPDPDDYAAVVEYIKQTPQQQFTVREREGGGNFNYSVTGKER